MTATKPLIGSAVVDELVRRFGSRFTTREIEECLDAAVADLKGSIAVESLPEMAVRLAAVRLTHRPPSGAPRRVRPLGGCGRSG